jgi:hypothetical protein
MSNGVSPFGIAAVARARWSPVAHLAGAAACDRLLAVASKARCSQQVQSRR